MFGRVVSLAARLGRSRMALVPWFLFVGLVAWWCSPFNGGAAIAFFLIAAYFANLVRGIPRNPVRIRRAIVLYLLTIADILGVATWHDLTVKTYASARCCDGWYSYSAHRQGTCSWHHGVCQWSPEIPPWWKTL